MPLENSYLPILSLAHPFYLPIFIFCCVCYSGHEIAILGLHLLLDTVLHACPTFAILHSMHA
jgi:hypothetical protein